MWHAYHKQIRFPDCFCVSLRNFGNLLVAWKCLEHAFPKDLVKLVGVDLDRGQIEGVSLSLVLKLLEQCLNLCGRFGVGSNKIG